MKKTKLGLLALALVLVLTACGGSGGSKEAPAGASQDPDTLRVAVASDAITLDPEKYNDVYSENVMKQIYNKLMDVDKDGKLVESLAESIDQPDAKTFIVHLKPGVKFHNGDTLKASDVVFSLKRLINSDGYSYIFGKIIPESLKATDDLTLEFKLNQADGSFLAALAHPSAAILSERAVTEAGDGYDKAPVGTGPYKFDSWTKLQEIKLSRFDDYFGDKAKIKNLVLRIIPEANNRVIELESGGVDLAYEVAPKDIQKIEENENLQVFRRLDRSIHFLGLRCDQDGAFANPKAREAMAHAINMEEIVNTVFQGVGKVATGPVNPEFPYSISDKLEARKYDPDLAKKLFAEAGIEPGHTFKLYVNDNQQRQDMAQIIQAQLQDLGYNVEITTLEWGVYMNAVKNKEHDMFIMSWNPSIQDIHYAMFSPFHSKNLGEGPNFMFYQNPEVDKLLSDAIQLDNGPDREQLYKQAQEVVDKDHPWIYIANGEQVLGASKAVKNFDILAGTSQALWTIEK